MRRRCATSPHASARSSGLLCNRLPVLAWSFGPFRCRFSRGLWDSPATSARGVLYPRNLAGVEKSSPYSLLFLGVRTFFTPATGGDDLAGVDHSRQGGGSETASRQRPSHRNS